MGQPVHAYALVTYLAIPSQATELHFDSGKSSIVVPLQFLMGTSWSAMCIGMAPGVPPWLSP